MVFDEPDLLRRLMDDRPLAAEIIHEFLANHPRQITVLRERLREHDADGTRRQAHSLKGAAGAVSAGRLRSVASEMERAALTGALATVRGFLPRMDGEFELLKDALRNAGWIHSDESGRNRQ